MEREDCVGVLQAGAREEGAIGMSVVDRYPIGYLLIRSLLQPITFASTVIVCDTSGFGIIVPHASKHSCVFFLSR